MMRLGAIIGIIAVALFGVCAVANAQTYAVGAGANGIYVFGQGTSWGSNSLTVAGANFSCVAVNNTTAYAVDTASNLLDVFAIGPTDRNLTPTITYTKSISLAVDSDNKVSSPTSIAIDSNGGIYVTGAPYWSATKSAILSNYAYISPGATTASINNINGTKSWSMAGVATSGSQALVLCKDVTPGTAGAPAWVVNLSTTGQVPFYDTQSSPQPIQTPKAITALANGAAYAISSGGPSDAFGWLSSVGSGTATSIKLTDSANNLDMKPTSITSFTLNGVNYVGVVGMVEDIVNGGTTEQAWKYTVDSSGTLTLSGSFTLTTADASTDGSSSCSASPDGTTFWLTSTRTSSGTGTALALDANTWLQYTTAGHFTGNNALLGIAGFTAVPEPSSLLALLAACGMLPLIRTKRRG